MLSSEKKTNRSMADVTRDHFLITTRVSRIKSIPNNFVKLNILFRSVVKVLIFNGSINSA